MPMLIPVILECCRCHTKVDSTARIDPWDHLAPDLPKGWGQRSEGRTYEREVYCPNPECRTKTVSRLRGE